MPPPPGRVQPAVSAATEPMASAAIAARRRREILPVMKILFSPEARADTRTCPGTHVAPRRPLASSPAPHRWLDHRMATPYPPATGKIDSLRGCKTSPSESPAVGTAGLPPGGG